MNLSELYLPLVRSLAFASGTTSASNARRENASATLVLDAADRSPSALIEQFQTRIAGLTEEEVRERLIMHGRNEVAHERSTPRDRMDPEFLTKPRKWDASGIARFMACIGPISSVFDVTTFALLWFVMGASTVARQGLFQSAWFIEGLLPQTLIVHMIRTQKVPFIQSTAALPVLLLTTAVMAAGIYLPFSRLGSAAGMARLPWTYFPWLAVTLLAYCALTQGVKTWYIRRFHAWL